MAKKYFSLIYGSAEDALHAAPGSKVIPAEEFSRLLESQEVLERVKEDAKKYRLEVATECEKLKSDAEDEGFDAGFQKWIEKITELEKEIQYVREEARKLIIPIALKAAKKIVGKEMESSPEIISSIVSTTLATVAQNKHVVLYVSRGDKEILDQKKSDLKQIFEKLEVFSIRARDDIEDGGCVIETESGIINAQLKHRWDTLERAFQSLSSVSVPAEEAPPST